MLLALGTVVWEGRTVSIPSQIYQWFASAGYRKPRPHFVRIVALSPSHEPAEIFADACKKREFTAALLDKIVSTSPSVVALDFWYPTDYCNSGDGAQRTAKLNAAIEKASTKFAIVLGSSTHLKHEFELENDSDLPKLKEAGFKDTDLILDPRYNFGGKNVSYGLVRVSSDTRRIPIFWPVYLDKSALLAHSAPERLKGFAYAAATRRDPRIELVLSEVNPANEHVFTTFVPESDFGPIHAIDLLCSNYKQGDDWRHCEPPDVNANPNFESLKRQVILVAQQNLQADIFKGVKGDVPGYVLQANYIESLLDDRYFRPISWQWELLLTFLGTIVILVIFESNPNPFLGLWRALLVVFLATAICNLLAVYLGRIIIFWFSLVTIVVVEFGFTVRKILSSRFHLNNSLPNVTQFNAALNVTENSKT